MVEMIEVVCPSCGRRLACKRDSMIVNVWYLPHHTYNGGDECRLSGHGLHEESNGDLFLPVTRLP